MFKQFYKKIFTKIYGVIARITCAEGMAWLVGGALWDAVVAPEKEPKDLDIEVFGLSGEELRAVLEAQYGTAVKTCGASFGVYKVTDPETGLALDFSLPRTENKVGKGHKGFEVLPDQDLTPKEAAWRRDLTGNTVMMNLRTGELFDPYEGFADIARGVIRAHNPAGFREDPLRVYRAAQLLARKAVAVHPDTLVLLKEMVAGGECDELPKERVEEEWNKLLLKAKRPSVGLRLMREIGLLNRSYPELAALAGCEQEAEFHPEGDVWEHTLQVVDHAAEFIRGEGFPEGACQVPEELRLPFMWAALLHDVGKPSTTVVNNLDGRISSNGHDQAGIPIAEELLSRVTGTKDLVEKVKVLVGAHHHLGDLQRASEKDPKGLSTFRPALKRLHNKFRLDVLAALSRCDSQGRNRKLWDAHKPSELGWACFREFGVGKVAPVVQGRDLIKLGLKPGPEFKAVLDKCYEAQIDGGLTTVEDVLAAAGIARQTEVEHA